MDEFSQKSRLSGFNPRERRSSPSFSAILIVSTELLISSADLRVHRFTDSCLFHFGQRVLRSSSLYRLCKHPRLFPSKNARNHNTVLSIIDQSHRKALVAAAFAKCIVANDGNIAALGSHALCKTVDCKLLVTLQFFHFVHLIEQSMHTFLQIRSTCSRKKPIHGFTQSANPNGLHNHDKDENDE